jgi:hypothetical protein
MPPTVEEQQGRVEVFPEYGQGLRDLEGFSHIDLLYHFHLSGPARLVTNDSRKNKFTFWREPLALSPRRRTRGICDPRNLPAQSYRAE